MTTSLFFVLRKQRTTLSILNTIPLKLFTLKTKYKQILADTITPVSLYFKIRDKFPNSLLLESSDYHGNDNSFSYICCNPIASIKIENEIITKQFPDGTSELITIDDSIDIPTVIQEFSSQFKSEKNDFKFINNGLFGYISYDAVRYFEKVTIAKKENSNTIPDIYYAVYQNIIAINHFKNQAYIFSHSLEGIDNIAEIEQLMQSRNVPSYKFSKVGDGFSNLTDEEFKHNVALAKKHCFRGDVFQLVLSRRFTQGF